MASGLGVRCNHCHAGPDNLQGTDFASDGKEHKRAAREMLRMVKAINATFLPAAKAKAKVDCFTCHRGQPEPPRALNVVLGEVATAKGAAAAVAEYKRLRSEQGEAGIYDFRDRALNRVATALAEGGKPDEALLVLKENAELFPASAMTHQALGQAYLQKGDAVAAVKELTRAAELAPEDGFVKKLLAEAQAKLPKP